MTKELLETLRHPSPVPHYAARQAADKIEALTTELELVRITLIENNKKRRDAVYKIIDLEQKLNDSKIQNQQRKSAIVDLSDLPDDYEVN